jgi:glycosyltransferase involved in cell wall biosynthesis
MALWKQLSSHASACLRALTTEATVKVMYRAPSPDAPYDDASLTKGLDATGWTASISRSEVRGALEAFEPDVILVCSWDVGAYRREAIRWRGRALRVLCMDNSWLGTPKQWAGRLGSPIIIKRAYDVAWLPGERQVAFAHRLGFGSREVMTGLYSCADEFFEQAPSTAHQGFLYVGRLAPEKGIDVLADAYAQYRASCDLPWDLAAAGAGPLTGLLRGQPGVEVLNFVQPQDLPALYRSRGCLVLPSLFEPWAVVVHEAAASGLPIVCTDVVGASTRLVVDGYNGRVVGARDSAALAMAMRWIATRSEEQRRAMSSASRSLAGQFTPRRWAEHLLDRVAELAPVHRR